MAFWIFLILMLFIAPALARDVGLQIVLYGFALYWAARLGGWWLSRDAREIDRRLNNGRCVNCGYDKRANPEGRCPKCGKFT